jgi:signal transduction histidine kinase
VKTLSRSELWLLNLMAQRGLALVEASALLVVIRQDRDLQVAAVAGDAPVRVRVLPLQGSALGDLLGAELPVRLELPSIHEAPWLSELGLEARSVLVERLLIEGDEGGLVIALRAGTPSFRDPDARVLRDFARSMTERLAAERSVELERLRHGVQARERERTRWARELHDETVQELAALRLMLAGVRDDDDVGALRHATVEAINRLDREIDGLRHLITDLRPAVLDDLGLVAAIDALARRAGAIDALAVETDIGLEREGGVRLDPELESAVYRIVQESLTNVAKHAGANRARVAVHTENARLIVTVSDDGRGFAAEPTGGFGLEGMRERAELVGGELEVLGRPGVGTSVRLTVPIAVGQAGDDRR